MVALEMEIFTSKVQQPTAGGKALDRVSHIRYIKHCVLLDETKKKVI